MNFCTDTWLNMQNIKLTILLTIFSLIFTCTVAQASKRVALVIGNGAYNSAPLKNPMNDARDISRVLKKVGFDVHTLTNSSYRQMENAIHAFGKKLQKTGGVGLFYYAGHGIQHQGRNYLIPIDADIQSASDVQFEAVDAGRILGKMEDAGNGVNIVILDACRNNPFARSFRSGTRGLAKMDAPVGSIMAYATSPGKVAADGEGRNGVYTKHLINYINKAGIPIEKVLKLTRSAVRKETNKKQTPWELSSLEGDFYFNSSGSGPTYRPIAKQLSDITGSLLVSTEPSGAKVWLDEGYEGRSPVHIPQVQPGLVVVKAEIDGYPAKQEKVRIREGRKSEVRLSLGKKVGTLIIHPTPQSSTVRILNIKQKYYPGVSLPEGEYKIEVSLAGYKTDIRKVTISAGVKTEQEVVLNRIARPDSPFSIGMGQFESGKYKDAYRNFEKVLGGNPQGERAGQVLFYMGESLYQQGEYDLAILDYQKVLSNHSGDLIVPQALLKQGMSFKKLTDHETAKIIYKKLIRNYPSSSEAKQAKRMLREL